MVTTNNMLLSYKDERFVMCSKKKKTVVMSINDNDEVEGNREAEIELIS